VSSKICRAFVAPSEADSIHAVPQLNCPSFSGVKSAWTGVAAPLAKLFRKGYELFENRL